MPRDPARLFCAKACPPDVVEDIRHKLELDIPVTEQIMLGTNGGVGADDGQRGVLTASLTGVLDVVVCRGRLVAAAKWNAGVPHCSVIGPGYGQWG